MLTYPIAAERWHMPETTVERLTQVQAIGRLLYRFVHGESMSTRQAMELTGYSKQGVLDLLDALSTYWEITQDEHWRWYMLGTFTDCIDGARSR
jgi:hypothetical protein